MPSFLQDLRYSLRIQAKTPVFSAIAILTLGLGIAAVVTVFSFSGAIFLRKIPVPNAVKLVRVALSPYGDWKTSYRQYLIFRDHNRSFQTLAAHYSTAPLYVRANEIANEVQSAIVTWNYFPMLGVQPALGRFFTRAEDSVPMRNPVVVISHDFWQARYQGDSSVLGQTLTINGTVFQIIGVAPKDFAGVEMGVAPNQLWIPTMMLPVGYRFCDALTGNEMIGASQPGTQHWECGVLSMIGTLQPGVTREQAAAEMQGLRPLAIRPGYNDTEERMVVQPIRGVREMDRRFFADLADRVGAAAAFLLLIACANVAGLLVARDTSRTREMAVRLAVGASLARIVRQLLTESLVLAVAGGSLGVLIAQWANRGLMNFYKFDDEGYPRYFDLRVAASVLSVAGVLAFLFAVLGVYCAVAFAVAQSTREIGVCMALGALPGQVVRVFVGRSLRMMIAGLAAGFVISAIGSRFVAAWLFGVSASDPMVFVVSGLVLATAAAIAAYLPALRAAGIEPALALRHE